MKFNKWTVGLAAVGVVSLASAARADEQMSQVQTALTQTTLSGYVDTAMQYNPGTDENPNGGPNLPHYSFAKNDGFSLNAIDIALDKPEDSSAWAAGYHVELMWGPNSVGIGTGDGTVRQAFIRLHTPVGGNGIDWQIGVWDSIIGYESNSDPLNPNYTRSYGYTIEPTTFTGILGTYKVNDIISFSAGIANDEFENSFTSSTSVESDKTYMGSVTLTAPDSAGFLKGSTLSGGVVRGTDAYFIGGGDGAQGDTTSFYIGATLSTPINQLKVGFSYDYLIEPDDFEEAGNQGDNIWDVAGYATIQATDKLSFNFRGEILNDSSTGEPDGFSDDDVSLYNGHYAEELTATVQYNLWANVMTRGEFRWDHADTHAFGADSSPGFEGDSFRKNDFLLALNVIYQF
jgi:Putative beta-barrel porin-2, OmpL-like. bbp2